MADPERDEERHPDTGMGQFLPVKNTANVTHYMFGNLLQPETWLFTCLCCCTRFLEHCMRPLECVLSVLILFDFGCEFLLGSFANCSRFYSIRSSLLKTLMIGVVCEQHTSTATRWLKWTRYPSSDFWTFRELQTVSAYLSLVGPAHQPLLPLAAFKCDVFWTNKFDLVDLIWYCQFSLAC